MQLLHWLQKFAGDKVRMGLSGASWALPGDIEETLILCFVSDMYYFNNCSLASVLMLLHCHHMLLQRSHIFGCLLKTGDSSRVGKHWH